MNKKSKLNSNQQQKILQNKTGAAQIDAQELKTIIRAKYIQKSTHKQKNIWNLKKNEACDAWHGKMSVAVFGLQLYWLTVIKFSVFMCDIWDGMCVCVREPT